MDSSALVQLRQWRDADLEPLAAMNADPAVMEFFPRCLSRDESRAAMDRQRRLIDERGWGLWVVTVGGEFAGFTGLAVPQFAASFTPCVEIGWRLRRVFWGRGIAFAAAQEAERFAFATLKLAELVSFTATINHRSRRLMERLGFAWRESESFLHPLLPEESPLRPHVLYRKPRAPGSAGGGG